MLSNLFIARPTAQSRGSGPMPWKLFFAVLSARAKNPPVPAVQRPPRKKQPHKTAIQNSLHNNSRFAVGNAEAA